MSNKQTKWLPIPSVAEGMGSLEQAAAILRKGGLVAIPTETVYGLAADATNPQAVTSIFEAKGRPQDNPLIVHIHDVQALSSAAREIPESALLLARHFWPGPLTMILPKAACIPSVTSAGLDTVAIRLPSHPIARALIRQAGIPLAAPSANRSGSPSPTTALHCLHDLEGRVDAIIDGGPCQVGVESTVISLVGKPRLLRPGAITAEKIRSLLPDLEIDPAVVQQPPPDAQVASPGMKYKHYAPHCPVFLVDGPVEAFPNWVNAQAAQEPGIFALCSDEDLPLLHCPALSLGPLADEEAQASHLFGVLRELDEKGAKKAYARCPQQKGIGLALYNRLIRAAAFHIIKI